MWENAPYHCYQGSADGSRDDTRPPPSWRGSDQNTKGGKSVFEAVEQICHCRMLRALPVSQGRSTWAVFLHTGPKSILSRAGFDDPVLQPSLWVIQRPYEEGLL